MNITLPGLIVLILQIFTYFYLTKLEECLCAQSLAKTETANLKYLRYAMLFLIAIGIVGITGVSSYLKLEDVNRYFIYAIGVYMLFLLITYVIILVHTYRLYRNMPETCECALQWPRYYLYFLAIASIIFIPSLFITVMGFGIVLSSMPHDKMTKNIIQRTKNKLKEQKKQKK